MGLADSIEDPVLGEQPSADLVPVFIKLPFLQTTYPSVVVALNSLSLL
jgi:hypothetical protein